MLTSMSSSTRRTRKFLTVIRGTGAFAMVAWSNCSVLRARGSHSVTHSSLPGPARNFHCAARLGSEAMNHGEPQAGALADTLGREEGLLGPRQCCLRSCPRRYRRRRPAHSRRAADRCASAAASVATGDRQRSALRHGVARIHRQVHERELELVGVDLDRLDVGRDVDADRDAGTDRMPQEIQHIGNEHLQFE